MELGNITEETTIESQNQNKPISKMTWEEQHEEFARRFNRPEVAMNKNTVENELEENAEKLLEEAKAEKYENWEREDQIRKEVQEREDNAYQRAVADMIKAGINPAIFGVNPASSGGGISSATKSDYSVATEMLNQAFESKENSKDRAIKIITALFAILGIAIKGSK